MITVWSVLWGDKYHPGYVYALRDAVEQNLSVPHRFKCLTDHDLPGIDTVRPVNEWQGWWQKICLTSRDVAAGPCLYFDLDVVITGDLDYLAPFTKCRMAAPANWAASGHGGIQSSVMAWDGTWHEPYERLDYLVDSVRLWGDQEYLWELLGDDWARIPDIGSYKYHVRPEGVIPDWMRVCVFHGEPKPHEVTDECLLHSTSILRSHIRLNMASGSGQDSSATALTA